MHYEDNASTPEYEEMQADALELTSDENGFIEVEGFKGKYELTDSGNKKTSFTLSDRSESMKLEK